MNEKTCIIVQNLKDPLAQKVRDALPDWNVIISKEPGKWETDIKKAEIICGWNKEIEQLCLEEESSLKWLQSWSAGVDKMPLSRFEDRGVLLTTASGVHAYPISETILAMMLGLTRKIHAYVRNQEKKVWHNAGLRAEMHGKTVAIIGVGEIGKETAKLTKAFGMTVLGVRHSGKPEENVDEMFTSDQLNDALSRADYVVLTVPLTEETKNMFGKAQFAAMKPSAFFINIGRGEVVDEEAMALALEAGDIAGAGLDVFATEPLPENSPLWEMENVIITPHTSGSTEYYDERVINDIFLPNLKAYLNGEKLPRNVVDYKRQY